MLTQQAQGGNLDLGTREPWQVFEQERSSMTLQLHRAGSQGLSLPRSHITGPTSLAVLPVLLGKTTVQLPQAIALPPLALPISWVPAGLVNIK